MQDRESLRVDVGFGREKAIRKPERPLRVLLIGNFSGSASSNTVSDRLAVTIDTLDSSFDLLRPSITVRLQNPVKERVEIEPRSIEDLHPDRLYESLPVFRVSEPNAMTAPAKDHSRAPTEAHSEHPGAVGDSDETESDNDEQLFGRLLGKKTPASADAGNRKAKGIVDSLIRSAFDEAGTGNVESPDKGYGGDHDAFSSAVMREILHDPQYRILESNWLCLDWLLRHIEEDDALIEIIDATREALSESLTDSSQLDSSRLSRLLCDTDARDRPDLIVGLFTFFLNAEDIVLLGKLGAISSKAGADFVSYCNPSFFGCNNLEDLNIPNNWAIADVDANELWNELRDHPAGQRITILTNRFIMRQPYGISTNPVESFEFEELLPEPNQEAFCWANPAILVARAAATGVNRFNDIPVPVYNDGSGQTIAGPTETLLSERTVDRLSKSGISCLAANRRSGEVRIIKS